jgi:23S rRNA (adenine2030-N6)-methyltransferase
MMREQDRATLLELHPAEFQKLSEWQERERRIKVFKEDSFKNFKAHLPPTCNRGVILIDPSYELIVDYENVSKLLKECIKRFSHGVYLIWYPVVERGADKLLLESIEALQIPKTLWAEISFRRNRSGLGISGTGMIIVNCPWQIDEQINSVLGWLTDSLVDGDEGSFCLDWLVKE